MKVLLIEPKASLREGLQRRFIEAGMSCDAIDFSDDIGRGSLDYDIVVLNMALDGSGYRFTAPVRSTVARGACQRPTRWGHPSSQSSVRQWIFWRSPHRWCARDHFGRRFDPGHIEGAASCCN
jgi:hypothetical protein